MNLRVVMEAKQALVGEVLVMVGKVQEAHLQAVVVG